MKSNLDDILNVHGIRKNIQYPRNKDMDVVHTYEFLTRFLTPFCEWPAYHAGVIDENGNILISRTKMNFMQVKAFTKFDLLVLRIKKMIEKSPQGFFLKNMPMHSFVSSLLKESEVPVNVSGGNAIAQKDNPMLFTARKNPLKIKTSKEDNEYGRNTKNS